MEGVEHRGWAGAWGKQTRLFALQVEGRVGVKDACELARQLPRDGRERAEWGRGKQLP